MSNKLNEIVASRMAAIFGADPEIKLQCQQDAQGNIQIPSGATMQLVVTLTVPELRDSGFTVKILSADGRELSDDEVAAIAVAMNKRAEVAA